MALCFIYWALSQRECVNQREHLGHRSSLSFLQAPFQQNHIWAFPFLLLAVCDAETVTSICPNEIVPPSRDLFRSHPFMTTRLQVLLFFLRLDVSRRHAGVCGEYTHNSVASWVFSLEVGLLPPWKLFKRFLPLSQNPPVWYPNTPHTSGSCCKHLTQRCPYGRCSTWACLPLATQEQGRPAWRSLPGAKSGQGGSGLGREGPSLPASPSAGDCHFWLLSLTGSYCFGLVLANRASARSRGLGSTLSMGQEPDCMWLLPHPFQGITPPLSAQARVTGVTARAGCTLRGCASAPASISV